MRFIYGTGWIFLWAFFAYIIFSMGIGIYEAFHISIGEGIFTLISHSFFLFLSTCAAMALGDKFDIDIKIIKKK